VTGHIVRSLGPDFFSFENLHYTSWGIGKATDPKILLAHLEVPDSVPFTAFTQGLEALLGGKEKVAWLLQTDLAAELDIQDPSQDVNLRDDKLTGYIPELGHLDDLKGEWVVPADPYLLLMMLPADKRCFLSICLDDAKKNDKLPFNQLRPDAVLETECPKTYGFTRDEIHNATHHDLLMLETFVDVSKQYGFKEIKQYIDVSEEERRDGANTQDGQGDQDEQTQTSQGGGGAEQALQNLLDEGEQDIEQMLGAIANDCSSPQTPRNIRLSNLAKDEYYKRHAKPLPIKSPKREAIELEVGKKRVPIKIREVLLQTQDLANLSMDKLVQFQLDTGLQCLFQLSPHQWRYDEYEWHETPIVDFEYIKSGIILPDNVIFRVDGSGSMLDVNGHAFVSTGSRYDVLMHVVYGVTKSMCEAASEVNKEVHVVGVSYSNQNQTRVSDPVELQHFYDTPNNAAKQVLLNPAGGGTHHDLSAYQRAYGQINGQTLEIVIADGDLNTDHDASIREVQKIAGQKQNAIAYFTIFQEGGFAHRMMRLAQSQANVTYKHFGNFNALQHTAQDVLIQYE